MYIVFIELFIIMSYFLQITTYLGAFLFHLIKISINPTFHKRVLLRYIMDDNILLRIEQSDY